MTDMNSIYLDANSTTRLDPGVRRTMQECLDLGYVNPASQHQAGQTARRRLEQARALIVEKLGGGPQDRLILTSGGTEANNLAILGLCGTADTATDRSPPPEVIISSIEHPSVVGPVEFLKSAGFIVRCLPTDSSGRVQVDALNHLMGPETRLVSVMYANNETGVIQDIQKAGEICRERGVPFHTDAVQAVGKIPVQFRSTSPGSHQVPMASALTLTSHKFHGPRGIGGLLVAEHVNLRPSLFGGFQQMGLRPGTEDVSLAVGFAAAVELAVDSLEDRARKLAALRDSFESEVLKELPQTVIHGQNVARTPHTSNLSFPGHGEFRTVNRQALLMAADAVGVAISTGSACASGSSDPSPVLTAMGLSQDVVESSIRVSFGVDTTEGEALEGARRIINAVKHLRQQKRGRK